MKFEYETDLRFMKGDKCSSHLYHKVIVQNIELHKNNLSYDMEDCLSTPCQPYA